MIDKLKLPFGLSVLEIVSLMGFLSLGYSLLYKISFYGFIGIPWYINNFTPQTLFFSSIKLIFVSFPAALLGWYCGGFFKNKSFIFLLFTFFIPLMFLSYLLVYEGNFIPFYVVPYIIIFIYMIFIGSDILQIKEMNYLPSKNGEKLLPKKWFILWSILKKLHFFAAHARKIFYSLIFITCFVLVPCLIGNFEAKRLIIDKENLLNEVLLNNDKENWYILDISSDKCLLINKNNEFKIINVNEIKQFKMPKKTRIL